MGMHSIDTGGTSLTHIINLKVLVLQKKTLSDQFCIKAVVPHDSNLSFCSHAPQGGYRIFKRGRGQKILKKTSTK